MLNALGVALGDDERAAARANRSMSRQGFVATLIEKFERGVVWGFVHSNGARVGPRAADEIVRMGPRFACCVGPMWYRNRFGREALRLLLEDLDGQGPPISSRIDRSILSGNFAAFVSLGNRQILFNDPIGLQQLYLTRDNRYFSTSWLAARAYAGDEEIDQRSAIEYVLQGATHSDRTVAPRVLKLPLGHEVHLRPPGEVGTMPSHSPIAALIERHSRACPIDDAVDEVSGHLRTRFADITNAFPGRINAALSGGFDSRLILAVLLSLDERPRLFVYGGDGAEDVVIATEIARAQGLVLDAIDKEAIDRDREWPDLEGLVQSALFFDGLPNDGIDDKGADRETRLAQNDHGRIALNGGGGEIFRNFFHLRNRTYQARDIVQAFYRGFDASVFRQRAGLAEYEGQLAASIIRSVRPSPTGETVSAQSDDRTVLSRKEIELVYPLFRCHHWMGLNNSLLVRHGYFCTPLIDLPMVTEAARLPLEWKNAGVFESRLIAKFHRGVAAHRSAYGFGMCDGPTPIARIRETMTCMRPTWTRPTINALRRRLDDGRKTVAPILKRYRSLLPGEWRLDASLDFQRLHDPAALSRLLAVEIVARELSP